MGVAAVFSTGGPGSVFHSVLCVYIDIYMVTILQWTLNKHL
jgi:hypothetical protein